MKCLFSERNSIQNNFFLEYLSRFYLSSMPFTMFMPVWFKYHRQNKGLLFDTIFESDFSAQKSAFCGFYPSLLVFPAHEVAITATNNTVV